ncbi:Pantothenate synthetase [compost metagenome]
MDAAGLRPDYLEVRHAVTLRPALIDDRDVVVIAAAYLGTTRLIDNLYLHLEDQTA